MGNAQFDRQTLISAVTNKSIAFINGIHTSPLAYKNYDVTQIFSPPKTVSRIIGFACYWYPCEQNMSTDKSIIISLNELNPDGTLKGIIENLNITGYDSALTKIEHGEPTGTHITEPSDMAAFQLQLKGMVFDDIRPLEIAFYNNIGYTTSAQREYRLFVEQEVIAR